MPYNKDKEYRFKVITAGHTFEIESIEEVLKYLVGFWKEGIDAHAFDARDYKLKPVGSVQFVFDRWELTIKRDKRTQP